MVYGAMSESGMSVDTLNDAVEALRAGLAGAGLVPGPRRDDQDPNRSARDATDQDRTAEDEEEAARQEDDVMERLENLVRFYCNAPFYLSKIRAYNGFRRTRCWLR